MASETKARSRISGERMSTSCVSCDGADEREEQQSPPEEKCTSRHEGDSAADHTIPIDRGWAWVVCAGCFVITFIMSLYDQVLAVMFVDVVDKFDVPVSTATVVFTIHAFTFSAGSVISTNVIVPKFGVRVVIVAAAIANSLTTVVIAFSPNVTFYLIFHLFKGLSIGSMWIPALGLLGHYFRRCRSVATSITNAGISVSLLITPLFVRELMDNLGFFGTLLIIAGVEMQAVAIGMLLRPPSRYARITKHAALDPHSIPIKSNEQEQYSLLDTRDTEVKFNVNDTNLSESVCKCNCQRPNVSGQQLNQEAINTLDPQYTYENQLDPVTNRDESLVRAIVSDSYNREVIVSQQTAIDSEVYRNSNPEPEQLSLLQGSYIHDINCPVIRQSRNAHFLQKNPLDMKAEMNESQVVKACSSVKNHKVRWLLPCESLRNLFDFNLLSDWLMRILLASTLLGALLQYIPTYIPTLAIQKGVDKTPAAVLLTICGGVNLVSTLFQGFVIDSKVITAAKFIAICQFIVGTMCHLTHFFTAFPTLVLLSVTYGMFGGARMSLMPVVAMDFVGVDNLSKALGFNAMIATLSLSLHHPFLGYLLERTSSFAVPFHYVGFALYISAGLLLLEKCARNLNMRRRHRERDS